MVNEIVTAISGLVVEPMKGLFPSNRFVFTGFLKAWKKEESKEECKELEEESMAWLWNQLQVEF